MLLMLCKLRQDSVDIVIRHCNEGTADMLMCISAPKMSIKSLEYVARKCSEDITDMLMCISVSRVIVMERVALRVF